MSGRALSVPNRRSAADALWRWRTPRRAEQAAGPWSAARRNRGLRWGSAVAELSAVLSLLGGCGGSEPAVPVAPQPCEPGKIHVSLIASEYINPSESGEARPVQVRVYQLKDDTKLLNASFEDIWNRDKETLGDALIQVSESSLYPATRAELQFERDPLVQFFSGVALFREPRGRGWFTSFELPAVPASCPPCEDPSCASDGVPWAPRLAFWVDKSRIEDGVAHLEDVPARGTAPNDSTSSGTSRDSGSSGSSPSAPTSLPSAPSAPQAPRAPSAPGAPSAPSPL